MTGGFGPGVLVRTHSADGRERTPSTESLNSSACLVTVLGTPEYNLLEDLLYPRAGAS